jgi:hypothetical protein
MGGLCDYPAKVNDEFNIGLNGSNSRVYRSKPGRPKKCHLRWEAAEYALAWGTQKFLGPHMVVIDPGGHYGVDLEVFFSTHRAIAEERDHYVKIVKVRALRTAECVRLSTQIKGKAEMLALVPAGAYIVQNPSGELYSMSPDEFEQRYEPDD